MAVNSEDVQRIIDAAMNDQAKSASDFIELFERAWIQLRDRRQEPGCSTDLDLAAAEHYLFARYMVASGKARETELTSLAEACYGKKLRDTFGSPNALAETLAPDLSVVTWGMLGGKHGAADHRNAMLESRRHFGGTRMTLLAGRSGNYSSQGTPTTTR